MYRKLFMIVAAVSLVVAACSSTSDDTTTTVAAAGETTTTVSSGDAPKVALLVNQSAGDQGPIDDFLLGLDRVKSELGAETTYVEVLDPAAYEAGLRNLGNEGFDVVVLAFPQIEDAVTQVAPEFPDTEFVHIYAFNDTEPNVITIGFAGWEGVYLAGLLAAQMTDATKLGYVGGASIPSLNANFNAFKQAAETLGIDDVTPTFADSFEDPAKGRDLGSALYADGVKVIMMDGGGTDQGTIEAGQESGGFGIGFSAATFGNDQVVPAAVDTKWGDTLFFYVKRSLDGGFVAGHEDATLASGAFDLVINDLFLENGPQDVADAVRAAIPSIDEARQAIIDGTLVVPFNPDL